MGLSSFIKKLVSLNAIWGARASKLAGINDRTNFVDFNNISFDSITSTITCGPATSIPNWMTVNHYLRITYRNPLTVVLPIAPDSVTNDFSLFRIKTVTLLGGNLSIVVDPLAPGVDAMTTYGPIAGRVDGRIAVVVNDTAIANLSLGGATVYNVDNETATGLCDGSGIAKVFADHYHGEQKPDNIAIRFDGLDWVNNRIEVLRIGVPGAGQIGPHNLTTPYFQAQVYKDIPIGARQVSVNIIVDETTGNLFLYKSALAPNFDGYIALEAMWKII